MKNLNLIISGLLIISLAFGQVNKDLILVTYAIINGNASD